ncbi:MAG: ThiF family adenylyltransferase [Thermoplasmata archaeon]|nr:MAG: ThiF family adenylyltransferase [Thermoplasmata archaeon]
MSNDKKGKYSIRVVMPSVASFTVEYADEEHLKALVCEKLDIEPEFTNLIFGKLDEDLTPITAEELDDFSDNEVEEDFTRIAIVDYIWARQMIALKENQKKLRRARALVVGAGALGNEIAKNLAWLGFGEITIVDYDDIEFSNVSRGLFEEEDIGKNKAQVLAERIGRNSPYAKVKAVASRVEEADEELLESQVILSALDNMPTRVWLASFAVKCGIPLIDGGIKEFQGRVQTYLPGKACLACNIPMDRYAEIMELSNPCEGIEFGAQASFTTISSVVAGVQANEAMKVVVGLPVLSGVLVMDFLKNNYTVLALERNENCFVCGRDRMREITVEDHGDE